jgi:membrane protein insertase Oxa1/YidC/SpoIIIJ
MRTFIDAFMSPGIFVAEFTDLSPETPDFIVVVVIINLALYFFLYARSLSFVPDF